MNWLGISAINPWLLWGAIGISAPIIIHLLSKRKYKVVNWAAMEFLLEADKRNRRRVRLEHLILLILRCLAILLLTLLVVRPFLKPTGLGSLVGAGKFERIVMVDDSPSMGVRSGKADTFTEAKASLTAFVRQTAEERPGDTLTLVTTSRPDQPVLSGKLFRESEDIVAAIERLELSDRAAGMDGALVALKQQLEEADASGSGHPNRVIYVMTDQRQRDWLPAAGEDDQAAAKLLADLREMSDGVVVVDAGTTELENLTVTGIRTAEKALTTGASAQFEVTVANRGATDATDVDLVFAVGDDQTYPKTIEAVPAGQSVTVPFTVAFAEPGSASITANIPADPMPADNERFFAAPVKQSVRVLIVDGDPSPDRELSETLYLEEALSPGLNLDPERMVFSGNAVDVVDETDFAATDLSRYQLIFVCNLYRIPADRLAALEAWVKSGGGLVFFLGGQVDAQVYNDSLYRGGEGLFPMKLVDVQGDESRRTAVSMELEQPDYPMMRVFAEAPLFLQYVKVYQWWAGEVLEKDEKERGVRVIARYTDTDQSPAIVEKGYGEGRVVVLTMTADDDWTNWPRVEMGPYMIAMQDVSRFLIKSTASSSNVSVGDAIVYDFDPARYASTAQLVPPGGAEGTTLQPITRVYESGPPEPADDDEKPTDAEQIESDSSATGGNPLVDPGEPGGKAAELVLSYDETDRRGLYRLELQRHSGEVTPMYFAVNLDEAEGDLRRVSVSELRSRLGEADVAFVEASTFGQTDDASARTETWRWLLLAMIVVLCLEQFLAWSFGRRR